MSTGCGSRARETGRSAVRSTGPRSRRSTATQSIPISIFKPNPSRAYATVGIEGLAPNFFDVQGALFLSTKGELLARAEGSYDQRITQRLILQPRAELNFAAQNTPETRIGAGLSDAELGLRLRYDIRREFAPYVGVQYKSAFGQTRTYLRNAGEKPGGWSLLTGIRTWF